MILLTGQRPGEVCGMSWSELRGDVWTIPAARRGKTTDAHTVPLTASALALLEQAPRRGEYVFSTRGTPIASNAVADSVLHFADSLGIAAVYDLHRYDAEKRPGLEAWERRLLRIAEGKPAEDNVVAINGRVA